MPNARAQFVFHATGAFALLVASVASLESVRAADDSIAANPAAGVEIKMHGGYPELRVDGAPFFVHGATFDYFRIPRDLWDASLDRYRELGINTIDIAIPWNWQEPREGEFDFDGHTNPRRDLRALLHIIAEKRFHLIVRVAPILRAPWRHGGYPDWLLDRPEIHMDAAERAAGRMPPLAEEKVRDADSAAQAWMADSRHMSALRTWLAAVAHELAPYSPTRKVRVTETGDKPGDARSVEINGPLLFIQLDESTHLDSASGCSHFWSYIEAQQKILRAGGVDAIFLVPSAAATGSSHSCAPPVNMFVHLSGGWSLLSPPPREGVEGLPAPAHLTYADAIRAEDLTHALSQKTSFVSFVSDFKPGAFAPADDVRPRATPPANLLLGSRLLFAQGIQGIEYAPLQDTLTPAGYDVLGANRYFRWDAALSLSGRRQPAAVGVVRNGQLADAWGAFLAASHKRADFALVDPRMDSLEQTAGRVRAEQVLAQIERAAAVAGLSFDLVDPASQHLEVLLRYPAVFLLADDGSGRDLALSPDAQSSLVEYVRRGGTLICFPKRPAGTSLDKLWENSPTVAADDSSSLAPAWRFGEGRMIEWRKDFNSWVPLTSEPGEDRQRPVAAGAVQSFRDVLTQAGVRSAVDRSNSELLVTERISDAGTGLFGARPLLCAREDSARDHFGAICNRGLLSVTNLSYDTAVQEQLKVLSPRASVRGPDDDYVLLDVQVPPHDSLFLPLHAPLCSDEPKEKCEDEVVVAGAELLRAERDARVLLLTFYTPARANIVVRLEKQPAKISIGDINLEGKWTPDTHLLEVSIPRGASPDFLRVVAVHLRYTPHVPARPDPAKHGNRNFDAEVADAVNLPLGEDASLPSYPPLVVLGPDRRGVVLYQVENHNVMGRDVGVKIDGPIHGSGRIALDGHELRQEPIHVSSAIASFAGASGDAPPPPPPNDDGLYEAELAGRSGRFERATPLAFLPLDADAALLYKFDFDRDGAKEWVLENEGLRLIVSPESGGRVLALVDKPTGRNLITSVGAARDVFAVRSAPGGPTAERDVTFNRAYAADRVGEPAKPAIRLRYQAAEIPGGATIEKTLRFTDADTVEVEYRVSLAAPAPDSISLVVMNSIPADFVGNRNTRFCWQAPHAPEAAAFAGAQRADLVCEPFVPGGKPIALPSGVKRVEFHTPGEPKLTLAWDDGTLRIEPRTYSALVKLELAPLASSGPPARYALRYTVSPTN